MNAGNKHQDCGAPLPQGEFCSGLNPPILSTNDKVTGATTYMLRKEKKKKRQKFQEEQGP